MPPNVIISKDACSLKGLSTWWISVWAEIQARHGAEILLRLHVYMVNFSTATVNLFSWIHHHCAFPRSCFSPGWILTATKWGFPAFQARLKFFNRTWNFSPGWNQPGQKLPPCNWKCLLKKTCSGSRAEISEWLNGLKFAMYCNRALSRTWAWKCKLLRNFPVNTCICNDCVFYASIPK